MPLLISCVFNRPKPVVFFLKENFYIALAAVPVLIDHDIIPALVLPNEHSSLAGRVDDPPAVKIVLFRFPGFTASF